MQTRTLLLGGAIVASLASTALFASGSMQEEFHQSYALSSTGRVALENINGDVHITVWDRNEVKVDAVKRAYSPERLEDARIVVDAGPNVITIKTRYPDHFNHDHPAEVEYTVTVPRAARLDEVRLINGALDITGVSGEVRASSVNGTVRARQLAGDAKLSTVNGALEAGFERLDPARSISINSVNGGITLLLPLDAHADFRASTVSGSISNDFGLPVDRGRYVGSHLNGTLKGGGARIKLGNVNGSIQIVPAWHGRRVRFT